MEKSSNFPKHSKESPVSRLDPTSTLLVLIGQCYWKRCWRRAHWHSMHSFIMCSQKDEGEKEWDTRGKVQLRLTPCCVPMYQIGWCVKRGEHLKYNRGDGHVFLSNLEINMFLFISPLFFESGKSNILFSFTHMPVCLMGWEQYVQLYSLKSTDPKLCW